MFFWFMCVNIIQIISLSVLKSEQDPVISRDVQAPEPQQTTLQLMWSP